MNIKNYAPTYQHSVTTNNNVLGSTNNEKSSSNNAVSIAIFKTLQRQCCFNAIVLFPELHFFPHFFHFFCFCVFVLAITDRYDKFFAMQRALQLLLLRALLQNKNRSQTTKRIVQCTMLHDSC